MSEKQIIHSPQKSRRQEARDLRARLYREIGLAAVATELFAPEKSPALAEPTRREDNSAMIARISGKAA
ncbi:hypothetical protein [Rhodoblastus sp.]|uniref:hypothetical protein n=1 Tax=Rhodoblastus sp. TaxID=1962975 RepID=UPI003F9BBC5A